MRQGLKPVAKCFDFLLFPDTACRQQAPFQSSFPRKSCIDMRPVAWICVASASLCGRLCAGGRLAEQCRPASVPTLASWRRTAGNPAVHRCLPVVKIGEKRGGFPSRFFVKYSIIPDRTALKAHPAPEKSDSPATGRKQAIVGHLKIQNVTNGKMTSCPPGRNPGNFLRLLTSFDAVMACPLHFIGEEWKKFNH